MNFLAKIFGWSRVQSAFERELEARLAERRAYRQLQAPLVKAGQSAAQRKAWAKDPLRNEMQGAA